MGSEQAGGTPGSGAMSERMRALLSRAAEEQLLEQRQVSSVLGELRALVEDVGDRLATGEQVDGLAAEVRALSARLDARLDAAETRSAELAERVGEATALLGRAAQDLAGAVAAQVAERAEAQLREVLTGVGEAVASSEGRLATHVDDAVLALAEVVLRRRRPAAPAPATAPPEPAVEVHEPAAESHGPAAAVGPSDVPAPGTAGGPADETPVEDHLPSGPPVQEPAPSTAVEAPEPDEAHGPPQPSEATDADRPDPSTSPSPGDGFVLVPADVEEPGAAPAGPVEHERRTADRRTSHRSDGSGRRRSPWWRPV